MAGEPRHDQDATGPVEQNGDAPSAPSLQGRVGRYTIKQMIGTGGMGAVYEAVQEQPRRVVALKVLRAGVAGRSALRRFEYESQLLARLRHPGIAQVYEAGTHDDGHGPVPFFAMEYIPGARTITDFAAAKKLGTRERMELVARVCDAVHHGHQKGIIHRDLKPGNILVDSAGDPKIIDFGVARATDSDMAVTTLQTDVGQLIGTLAYMSPEQCAADPHDIDVRSDVYALGVVLYELLCGRMPYDVSRSALAEATRKIREQEPAKLSTLDRTLRGDPETIALKALEKERERRYRSAADLADDLRRYLKGEPISARPPSVAYQVRVFARRHRGLVGAVVAVMLTLAAGVVAFAWKAHEAGVERDRAREAEQAVTAERDRAAFIKDYLVRTLEASDPQLAGRPDIRLTEAMMRGVEGLDSRMAEAQPESTADIFFTTASVLSSNGDRTRALPLAERALDLRRNTHRGDHASVAQSLEQVASLRYNAGRLSEAVRTAEEQLAMCERLYKGDHPGLAQALSTLAFMREAAGAFTEAETLGRRAVAMYERLGDETTTSREEAMLHVSYALESQGRFDDAEELCAAVLAARRARHAGDHPSVADAWFCVGRMRLGGRRLDGAEAAFRESMSILARVFTGDHPSKPVTLYNLAATMTAQGRHEEAIACADQAVAMARRLFGEVHPAISRALWRAGSARLAAGDARGALPLLEECVRSADGQEIDRKGRVRDYQETLDRCRAALREPG